MHRMTTPTDLNNLSKALETYNAQMAYCECLHVEFASFQEFSGLDINLSKYCWCPEIPQASVPFEDSCCANLNSQGDKTSHKKSTDIGQEEISVFKERRRKSPLPNIDNNLRKVLKLYKEDSSFVFEN